jgi:Right handed beta helix region
MRAVVGNNSLMVNVEDWKRGSRTWSDAFNAAINFVDLMSGGKGGEVFVPAGPEIELTTTITLKNNIKITGRRALKVSAWASGATTPLFGGNALSNIEIEGLSIEHTELWTAMNYFVYFTSCENVRLKNMDFLGVRGTTAQGVAVYVEDCTNVLMEDLNFRLCRGPQVWLGNTHVTLRNLYLYDCYSVQLGYGGSSIPPADTPNTYVLLENIRNIGCYQEGIELNNYWRYVTIKNCWIIDCARQGGEMVDCGGLNCGDLIIDGLYILRGIFPSFSGAEYGMRIKQGGGGQADRTLITNVHISGFDRTITDSFGISLNEVSNCILSNIYIQGGAYGITTGTGGYNNTLSNARLIDNVISVGVRSGMAMHIDNVYCEPATSTTTGVTRGVHLTGGTGGPCHVNVIVKGATYGVDIDDNERSNVTGSFYDCQIGVWAEVSASAAYIHDITAVSCSIGVRLAGAAQTLNGLNALARTGSLYGVRVDGTATKALVGAVRCEGYTSVLSDTGTSTETFGIRT